MLKGPMPDDPKQVKKEGKIKKKDAANRKFMRKNAKNYPKKKRENNTNNKIKVVGAVSAKLNALIQRLEQNNASNENANSNQGENKSVIEATIFWKNRNNDCIIYNLQNKFPNIAKLTINHRVKNKNNSEVIIEIKENKDSKVNKLNLNNLNYKTTKLYCQPFENLIKIKIFLEDEILNLKRTLPIFSDDCKIIFKSLKSFHLKMDETKKMNSYTH